MVATALNRPPASNQDSGDEAAVNSSREKITRLLEPALKRLRNRLVILAGFGVIYAMFAVFYWDARVEHTELRSEISQLNASLSLPSQFAEDVEAEFALYTAAIEGAKGQQIRELRDSRILEQILEMANATGVSVASTGISSNSVAPLGDDIYEVTPILLQVDGTLAELEAFIGNLEGETISTMEVENATISNSEEGYTATVRTIVFNKPVAPGDLESDEDKVPTGRVTNEELDRAAGGGS